MPFQKANPLFPFRVFGLNKQEFKAAFVDAAVNVDALDFRPILVSAVALLAAGQRFLSWEVDTLTGNALWVKTEKLLSTFLERLREAKLSEPAPFLRRTRTEIGPSQ
jgi:hypothetical protein